MVLNLPISHTAALPDDTQTESGLHFLLLHNAILLHRIGSLVPAFFRLCPYLLVFAVIEKPAPSGQPFSAYHTSLLVVCKMDFFLVAFLCYQLVFPVIGVNCSTGVFFLFNPVSTRIISITENHSCWFSLMVFL